MDEWYLCFPVPPFAPEHPIPLPQHADRAPSHATQDYPNPQDHDPLLSLQPSPGRPTQVTACSQCYSLPHPHPLSNTPQTPTHHSSHQHAAAARTHARLHPDSPSPPIAGIPRLQHLHPALPSYLCHHTHLQAVSRRPGQGQGTRADAPCHCGD